MKFTHTHTFATLEVSPETFADVRTRLERAGALGDYLMEDDSKAPLLVFGGVALKVESTVHSPQPEVELVAVPIYDSPALTPAFREILNKTPWERLPTDCPHPAFVREVTGIVIGCGIIAGCEPLRMVDGKWNAFPDFSQTAAEIMNLILMCGGKRPKPSVDGGGQ